MGVGVGVGTTSTSTTTSKCKNNAAKEISAREISSGRSKGRSGSICNGVSIAPPKRPPLTRKKHDHEHKYKEVCKYSISVRRCVSTVPPKRPQRATAVLTASSAENV